MMRGLLLVLLAALLVRPAWALDDPKAGERDPRVRFVAYAQDDVVELRAAVGATVAVQFADTERVTDVAASDRANMKVAPDGAVLFLKAERPMAVQPIFVKTRRKDGSARLYAFQWQAENDDATLAGSAYYVVRFVYPADAAAERAAAWRKAREERAAKAAQEALALAPPPGPPNWRYVAQGDRNLVPDRIWDDGQTTFLHFPGNVRLPAVYVIAPDGKEALTNYSVQDGTIAIHQTARQFRLRDGDTVLCIYNQAWNPVGSNPGTGTTSPSVVRTMKAASP